MNGVRRREFLLAVGTGSLLASLPALAQQEKRVRRIGYLGPASAEGNAEFLAAFREGMAALRWVEGSDYVIDVRYGNGVAQAMPALAAELVATQPDLLLTPADASANLLAQSTKTIPIVFGIAADPVGNRLAVSLQRPGGNVTGLANLGRDLSAKRLQLLKEAFPRVARVALLLEPENLGSVSQAKEIEDAAPRLGIRITPIELRQPADIEPAFKRGVAMRAQAYMVTQSGVINSLRRAIAESIIRLKVPSIFPDAPFVEAGGLISYGPSRQDNFRRAASYVDKILKGASPGELPIEQPTKFETVLNLKTAKAIGVTFLRSFLLRADRMIE